MSSYNPSTGLLDIEETPFRQFQADDAIITNSILYRGILLDPSLQIIVDDLSGVVDVIELGIVDLSGRVFTNETNIADASGRIFVNETNIADASGRIFQNETDITDLSGRVFTNETNIADASGRIFVNETNIADASGRIFQNETDITDLSGRVFQNETDITDISGKVFDISNDYVSKSDTSTFQTINSGLYSLKNITATDGLSVLSSGGGSGYIKEIASSTAKDRIGSTYIAEATASQYTHKTPVTFEGLIDTAYGIELNAGVPSVTTNKLYYNGGFIGSGLYFGNLNISEFNTRINTNQTNITNLTNSFNDLVVVVDDVSNNLADVSNNKVSKTGDTMTGNLVVNDLTIGKIGGDAVVNTNGTDNLKLTTNNRYTFDFSGQYFDILEENAGNDLRLLSGGIDKPFTVSAVRGGGHYPFTTWEAGKVNNFGHDQIEFHTGISNEIILSVSGETVDNYKTAIFREGLLIATYTPPDTAFRLYTTTGSDLNWNGSIIGLGPNLWDICGTFIESDRGYNGIKVKESLTVDTTATSFNPTLLLKNTNNADETSIQITQPYTGTCNLKLGVLNTGDAFFFTDCNNYNFTTSGGTLQAQITPNELYLTKALRLATHTPTTTTSRLYTPNGTDLYWNGSILGGGGSSFFTDNAPVMEVNSSFQTIDFSQNTKCVLTNSQNALSLTSGSNYAEVYIDGTNDYIDMVIGPNFAGRQSIMAIRDDATNFNPTVNVRNTKATNSECSIQVNQSASGSHLAKFGVNSSNRAFVYANGASFQTYINGGTAMTLVNGSTDVFSLTPSSWTSGDNFLFGLGDLNGNLSSYNRSLNFVYNDGIYYNTTGKHIFYNNNFNQICGYADNNGFTASQSLTTYPYTRVSAYYAQVEARYAVGDIYYYGINGANSSEYKILNAPIGGFFVLTRAGLGYLNAGQITTSDRRIKKDIQEINDGEALEIVKKIQPKSYKYIDENRGTDRVYGYIAQEVREVFPPAVVIRSEALPNVQQWFDISGDIITFQTPVDISCVQIQLGDLSGEIIDTNDLSGEIIDPSRNTQPSTNINKQTDPSNNTKPFNRTDVRIIKKISNTTYQVNQVIPYEKGYCYGFYVDDFHTLSKEKLLPIIHAGVQEQQRMIESLQKHNEELVLSNKDMKLKVASLESKIEVLTQALVRANLL